MNDGSLTLGGGMNKKKILIIEDEERIRNIYTALLVERGFLVRAATDATQATNILIREDVDLILLDLKMPEVNGRTMFEIIQECNPHTKVIISSVYPIDRQKQMVTQAADYHDKSQGLEALLEKIDHSFIAI